MAPPRKAIITITSAHAEMYGEGKETGLFVTEALHPFEVFRKNGFEVDLVSETGTYVPDFISLTDDWISKEDKAVYEDHNSEFRSKLDKLLKPSDVDPSKYGLFFASAGHASLIDYPNAKGLQSIGSKVWDNGGIVSAVCHGGAIFPNMIDPKTGKSIISGRKVTGFTTKGEIELGALEAIKGWDVLTIEEGAEQVGATYVPPNAPFDCFTVTDGNLVSGVNPQSAQKTAEDAVAAFQKL